MASRRDSPDHKPRKATGSALLVPPASSGGPSGRESIEEPAAGSTRAAVAAHLHRLNLVWLQLRGDWAWMAVVPAEPDFSTAELSHTLSRVGAQLSGAPVHFVEAVNVDLDSSAWLIGRLGSSVGESQAWQRRDPSGSPNWTQPTARTIVALESPLANPLALPVALAADGVILCVRRGRSRVSSVRNTISAVGADRIRCAVLLD
jgi:hypothetical protein